MKRLLLVPALVLLSACGGQATQENEDPAAPPEPTTAAADAGGAAAGACLVGALDCQDTGPGSSDTVPGEPPPYDPATAPAFVRERPALPPCGEYGVGPRPLPQAVLDCFGTAVGTPEGAEYAVADRTEEGDVVVRYYRALPGTTGVEVLYDATRDAFGTGRWQQISCTGYDAARGAATGCGPDGSGEI